MKSGIWDGTPSTLEPGVAIALRGIVKGVGYRQDFPLEGSPDRDYVMGIYTKHVGKLPDDRQKLVLNELEGNWSFHRDGINAETYLSRYSAERTPGRRGFGGKKNRARGTHDARL